jgi:hypothetical protein
MVLAIRDNHSWDILLDVETEPKRVPSGGYVCDLCRPTRARCSPTARRCGRTICSKGKRKPRWGKMAGPVWQPWAGELGAAAAGRRSLANAAWRRPDPQPRLDFRRPRDSNRSLQRPGHLRCEKAGTCRPPGAHGSIRGDILLQVEPLTPVCDAVSTAEGKASHVLLR